MIIYFGCLILLIFVPSHAKNTSKFQNRIVGGTIAKENTYPYIASIRFKGFHFCGGSIIDQSWILTAAHCFIKKLDLEDLSILVGTSKLSSGGEEHFLDQVIQHEDFQPVQMYNDIALLKLKTPIIYNNETKPIKLVNLHSRSRQRDLTILGWGNTEPDTKILSVSEDLLELPQRVVNLSVCRMYYVGMYEDKQICVISARDSGSCVGDSGGPLVNGKGELVGVLSFGTSPCAMDAPTVYTDVRVYKRWIRSVKKGREKRNKPKNTHCN